MEEEMLVRPCLVCNKETMVRRKDWVGEAPAAFCLCCCKKIASGLIAWELVRMLFMIRCSLQSLYTQGELITADIRRLYGAQEELEQDLLRSTRAA